MDINEFIRSISNGIKVKEISCTRVLKTASGEHQVFFRAEINDISLLDAKISAHLLSLQTEIAVLEHAFASGDISKSFMEDSITSIKSNYFNLLQSLLSK
jgi:hypothetical protein